MSAAYQKFLNECMLEFMKKILVHIQEENLYLNQLIYISYRTDNETVILSQEVKKRYPREITIVLQYQFKDLIIDSEGFSLKVSFDGVEEKIYIPFDSVISFTDSSNGYSFKFNRKYHEDRLQEVLKVSSQPLTQKQELEDISSPNVIMLDKFRKPNKPTKT